MPFITTLAEYIWDGEKYVLVRQEGYEYDGPVALCKKGRGEMEDIAKGQRDQMRHDQAVRDQDRAKAMPIIDKYTNTGWGNLSDYAAGDYSSQMRDIEDAYGSAMRSGLRSISQRGFGSVPVGAASSNIRSIGESKAKAETGAYDEALNKTNQGRQVALNYLGEDQRTYNPSEPAKVGADAAFKRSQMGSTLGDIGQGISTGVGIATAIGTGGQSLGLWGKKPNG